jgi:hypothetical protein
LSPFAVHSEWHAYHKYKSITLWKLEDMSFQLEMLLKSIYWAVKARSPVWWWRNTFFILYSPEGGGSNIWACCWRKCWLKVIVTSYVPLKCEGQLICLAWYGKIKNSFSRMKLVKVVYNIYMSCWWWTSSLYLVHSECN